MTSSMRTTTRTPNATTTSEAVFVIEEDWDAIVRFTTACMAFEALGLLLAAMLLAVSIFHCKRTSNAGVRLFTANLMTIDLLHAAVSFCTHLSIINDEFYELLETWDVSDFLTRAQTYVETTTLLVFNSSFVPVMTLSIIAFYSPTMLSSRMATVYYVALIFVADLVPITFQALCYVFVKRYSSFWSIEYFVFSFVLLAVEVALTSLALRSLWRYHRAAKGINGTSRRSKRDLIGVLLFAIGPCLIQIPVAGQLVISQLNLAFLKEGTFMYPYLYSRQIVAFVFSAKPAIDAICIVLFLSEYRQYSAPIRRVVYILLGCSDSQANAVTYIGASKSTRATADKKPNVFRRVTT